MKITVIPDKLLVNDVDLSHAGPPALFETILESVGRIVAIGPPAPIGHRNNQAWLFDDLGLALTEHHASCRVSAFSIILEPEHAYRKTRSRYSDRLTVCGVSVQTGMLANDFAERSETTFRSHLGHSLVFDGDVSSIDIATYSALTSSGKKSRRRLISSISIGFHDAHLPSE